MYTVLMIFGGVCADVVSRDIILIRSRSPGAWTGFWAQGLVVQGERSKAAGFGT